ncbi:AAA family ATPase [Actinokineospora globicatena]|uniref:ATPase AAA-type core domain-containing protein n=1 Tax=Actinokineospora globicatena TaxID=103729 RepID=A0A9W6VAZ8_9PSEU|nr:AAA family ATPase [Actinokineospora globicatena]GLW94787.1 hypothetical protein Aglo03_56030 [Actinokineospora globicatena]
MKVREASFVDFKGFTSLVLRDIPESARLVVMAGPNGRGKSSVFDGFRAWQGRYASLATDNAYYTKVGRAVQHVPSQVSVTFDAPVADNVDAHLKAFYFRTAYRLEADFSVSSVSIPGNALAARIGRMTDVDVSVSLNYQRMIYEALNVVFDGPENNTAKTIRDGLLGDVRESMQKVFGDLIVENLANPVSGGSFYFSKGDARNWHYKNLSGGEKAAFDLLLDFVAKRTVFDDSVYCIDEPEIHLNTRVQGLLLNELLRLLPGSCQLWISTHSIGMLTAAKNRQAELGDVCFLDFEEVRLDESCVIAPAKVDRRFWGKVLNVALDDLASLVAPRKVVIVEGRPKSDEVASRGNVEFDAACLRNIFGKEMPDVEFVSVGSSIDVKEDRRRVTDTVSIISPGTEVLRLVDRDDLSNDQRTALRVKGVRVLSERDLENYLLSDETLRAFCVGIEKGGMAEAVIDQKNKIIAERQQAGIQSDDIKRSAGLLYDWMRRTLDLRQMGTDVISFLRDTMSQYVKPGSDTYNHLKEDIFGR